MNTPTTTDEWLKIWQKFKGQWNFPNGIGAVDGKHIIFQQPKNSGSHYGNYKGTSSIIFLAMVGPEYKFLFTNVGINGRNSDGGNMSQSLLKSGFETNTLNLPNPMPLQESYTLCVYWRWCFSFVFVYNEALKRKAFSTIDSPEWDVYWKMSLVSWQTAGEYLEGSISNPKRLRWLGWLT